MKLTYCHSFKDTVNRESQDNDETSNGRQKFLFFGGSSQHRFHLFGLFVVAVAVDIVVVIV
jgi:hypothetical protein